MNDFIAILTHCFKTFKQFFSRALHLVILRKKAKNTSKKSDFLNYLLFFKNDQKLLK